MSECNNNFNNRCCGTCFCDPCRCHCQIPAGITGPTGATGATGPVKPFLSGYIEASGATQNVANKGNVVFDISPDALDVVGTDITLDNDGSTFVFHRTGLYRVEWSLALESGTLPIIVCLLENGSPSSAMMKAQAATGNFSSGALIHVDTLPFTVSLHNFEGDISLLDPANYINTAASIRISRFADAPIR